MLILNNDPSERHIRNVELFLSMAGVILSAVALVLGPFALAII